ncbi:putative T7SS-secreted protein [Streptomyces aculeolatus]
MSPLQPADFSSLGFMPCPGDVRGADDVAKVVRRTARALSEICHVLHGTGPGDWKGKAAEAFREKFEDDFRPKMDEARDSFGMAATALEGWAEYMRTQQDVARQLEREAEDAERELSKALRRLDVATDDDAKPPAEGSPDRYRQAGTARGESDRAREEEQRHKTQGAVDNASLRLEDVRRRARSLADDYRAEGQMVANRLRGAMEIAPDEPGLFDKIADTISDLSGSFGEYLETVTEGIAKLADDVAQWVEDHAYAIAAIGDVFSALSAITGLVGLGLLALSPFCPPLALVAGAFETVAAGTAFAALLAHGTARLAGGEDVVANRSLMQDTLGALPFGAATRVGADLVGVFRSTVDHGGNFGLVDSWTTIMGDPTALGYFVPQDKRQAAELGLPAGAGAMLVAFENAWNAGSEKDRAARNQRAGSSS